MVLDSHCATQCWLAGLGERVCKNGSEVDCNKHDVSSIRDKSFAPSPNPPHTSIWLLWSENFSDVNFLDDFLKLENRGVKS